MDDYLALSTKMDHGIDMKTIGNGSGSSGYGGVDGTLSSSSSGSTISPAVDNNHRRWGSEINSSSYLIAPPSYGWIS